MKQVPLHSCHPGLRLAVHSAHHAADPGAWDFFGDSTGRRNALSGSRVSIAAALILSGGPNSVYDTGAPSFPQGFWSIRRARSFPVLGICYGMQLLARALGGDVHKASTREYGRMEVHPKSGSEFFTGAHPSRFRPG